MEIEEKECGEGEGNGRSNNGEDKTKIRELETVQ